ncbi:F-box/kelch-repeat protein At3g06240-like [Papaver somniferum]|uniref:F-box/kelch-repeat protein At3g06240-like n=1 Tax=Papaver somniferum TaxID=3469 RepID=UPI000E704FA5|nr:F-box/kelch-repeat protein At3g06240-like [Papaver somniferum]
MLNNYMEAGVFFNGAFHWLWKVNTVVSKRIVSLKMGEEKFEEVKLPTALPEDQYYMDMGVLDGRLCRLSRFKETLGVWIMKDYGVQESWSNLYTLRFDSIMCVPRYDLHLMGPSRNGEILFSQLGSVVLYIREHGTVRKQNIHGLKDGGAVSYSESSVSIDSIIAAERRKKRKITRNLKKSTTKKRNRDT